MLTPFIIAMILIVLAGSLSACFPKGGQMQRYPAAAVICLVSILTLVHLLRIFGSIQADHIETLIGWQLPFAGMQVGIDTLSAFFLIPLLIIAFCSSLYGPHYLKAHPAGRLHWLFVGLLISGMAIVLLARNAVLFLLAWEIMSLSSFFLVITDQKQAESIRAGWIYFITAHIGTAFLIVLFFLLARHSGSFNFVDWKGLGPGNVNTDLIFIIALIAFGMKAGFIPFHVWLPLAHPAAPSHVSALMSGIMIKMGIYGLLRVLTFITPLHAGWGTLLIILGAVSGILGVLFAIGQHDIKRLLAYHSVENIGIILMGIGVGIVGLAYGNGTVAVLGFSGGLLHILNHALFKALLFLGAGAVINKTGSGNMDRLGGLIKSMPWTALLFLIGAVAICGLPFFNGFISELMIYSASITGAVQYSSIALPIISLTGVISLALIGGLAAACFTKVFGIVFLGEPRTESASVSHDVPAPMIIAMMVLAVLCVLIGLGSPFVLRFLIPPTLIFTESAASNIQSVSSLVTTVSIILVSLAVVAGLVMGLIKIFSRKRVPAPKTVTWDCGYSMPAPTMQYTASSFADPIVNKFRLMLGANEKLSSDGQLFPAKAWSFHSGVEDWFMTRIYSPAIQFLDGLFSSMRWFQSGKTEQYIFYIAVTVFGLILWKFFI